MQKRDYLIQLIQSLSPNERRYFRLYSDIQSGEKKYMQLYGLLEDRKEYNASAIGKEMGISAAQLAKLKHYLNQELLRCLRNYNEEESEVVSLHNARADGRELIKRRLYDYALDVTEKALERAWELEQFELIYSLLAIQHDCLFNLGWHDNMRRVADNRKKLGVILSEVGEMDFLDAESMRLERNRLHQHDTELKKLLRHPLLAGKPEKLLSLRAKAVWYRTVWRVYNELMPGSKDLLGIARAQKQFYERNPSLKVFYSMAYLNSFAMLADAEIAIENYGPALEIYSNMERLIDNEMQVSRRRAVSVKSYIYISRMVIFSKLGQFEKVLPEEKKLQPLIGQRTVYEQTDAALTLAIAQVHLQRSDLAIDKLNEMMELDIPGKPPHLKTLRPLQMMAQIDLGNYQLIPYLIKSAKSWLKRNKYVEPEYDIFFSLMAAVANPSKNTTSRKAYARLMQAVSEGKLKGLNRAVYLDKWVQGKTNLSLA
jgi:hypothetical protein